MKVFSIFSSVNGEANILGIGSFCTFIRFAGCSATCSYCDTTYASEPSSGKDMTVDDILLVLQKHPSNNITITGGEPFEQRDDLIELLHTLIYLGYNVTVETNGLHDFNARVFSDVHWVVDIKSHIPISRKRYFDMNLRNTDYIKIVVRSYAHFLDMLVEKRRFQFEGIVAHFAFSPEYGVVNPNDLVRWMIESGEGDMFLNVQLHKLIGLKEPD